MPESEAETLPDDLIARTRPCPSCEQAMNLPTPNRGRSTPIAANVGVEEDLPCPSGGDGTATVVAGVSRFARGARGHRDYIVRPSMARVARVAHRRTALHGLVGHVRLRNAPERPKKAPVGKEGSA